jgi:hypothetical protein
MCDVLQLLAADDPIWDAQLLLLLSRFLAANGDVLAAVMA